MTAKRSQTFIESFPTQGPEAIRVLSAEPFPASQLEGPLNQTTCRRPHQLDIDQNQTIKNATDYILDAVNMSHECPL